jgi:hypothetical protein
MTGYRSIEKLLKGFGKEVDESLLRDAAELSGYETTEKYIKPINGKVDTSLIKSNLSRLQKAGNAEEESIEKIKVSNNSNINRNEERKLKKQKRQERRKNTGQEKGFDNTSNPTAEDIIDSSNKNQSTNDATSDALYREEERVSKAAKTAESTKSTEIPHSSPNSNPIPSDKELKGKAFNSKTDYMRYKKALDGNQAIKDFDAGNFENPILKQMITDGNAKESITKEDILTTKNNMVDKASAKNMNFMDSMGYYKVPQKAVGIGATAWLVNKLAADKGQQSNAQLYNQQ